MFRAIIFPIFRSTRLCTHDVAGHWPATSWVHYTTSCNTQSSAPEDDDDDDDNNNNNNNNIYLTAIGL